MKRPLNFWNAFFLMLLFLKLSGLKDLTLFHVFMPIVFEAALIIFDMFGFKDKLMEAATRFLIKVKVWQIKRSLKK